MSLARERLPKVNNKGMDHSVKDRSIYWARDMTSI